MLKESYNGSVTSSGDTDRFIDSTQNEPDDWFNGGVVFYITGDNSLHSANILTSGSSGLITHIAVPHNIQIGDEYLAMTGTYSRGALVAAINRALQELGPVTTTQIMDVSDDTQKEFTITGYYGVKRVETTISTAEPYDWVLRLDWTENNGKLYFNQPLTGVNYVRLWYNASHDYVNDDEDIITDSIHPQLITWMAVYYATLQRMLKVENDNPRISDHHKESQTRVAELKARYPVPRIARDVRHAFP
jgi:hypothetical protein